MFWGLILKANKRYTQVLEKPFHLSQASLDHSTADDEPVQVMYSHEDRSYLLCTLQKGKQTQCMLDLNFGEGEKLCFLTKGNGIVHLTGFLIPDQEDDEFADLDMEGLEDEEEEEDDEQIEDLRQKLKGKQQKEQKQPAKAEVANKKKKPAAVEESSEDESEDEDYDETIKSLNSSAADEDDASEGSDDSDDDEEEEEEDEEDESDEEEEEVAAAPAKKQKVDPQQNNKKEKQNGVSNGQEKKKDNKKEKKEQQQQPQQQQQKGAGQMQKMQGGLMVQDLKVGSGAEAKPGKKIQVYYEGKLKSNNKTFDSSKSGPGFKMTLGRGEVIKGWDIGLQGMKVGGKRKLIIPPALGYGPRGNPPVIPANSTLVFDVELKNVF